MLPVKEMHCMPLSSHEYSYVMKKDQHINTELT